MQIKRALISLLLLLTYSLGFAHYLIPHCEANNIEHQVAAHEGNPHHHHEHHQHAFDDKHIDHEDIVHNDHLDGGVYDLVVCLLGDMEHPYQDCNLQHYLLSKTNDNVDIRLTNAKLVSILLTVFGFTDSNKALSEFSSEVATVCLSPPIGDSPHRGPPSLSC
ncbi:MAG: hypothetical protein RLP15_08355 [Cryomorphaceae bacterium]